MSTNYELLDLYTRSQDEGSSKYFGLSIAFHIALVIGSFYLAAPALNEIKKDIITFEILTPEEELPIPVKTIAPAQGEKVAETRGAKPVLAPPPSAPIEAVEAPVIAGPVPKSKVAAPKAVAQIKTHTSGGTAPEPKSAVSKAGVPETLEDIAAPELDVDGVEVAQVGNLGDNEFENEFKKVDHSNAAAIMAQKAELDAEAKLVADEKDAAMKAIEQENAIKAKAMEDAMIATRNKNAATLVQMRATEKAAAEKAVKDAKDAADAAAAAEAANNRGTGENVASNGRGNGDEGADETSPVEAGEPNGVRSLEQLKQLPGNPRPQYSTEERLRRQFGDVIFYAFITKQGQPTEFRMVQSTGHRNLDTKTLAALKKWKFYPGQEGWVELPFKWDLKGGIEEMPASLRRVGTQQ